MVHIFTRETNPSYINIKYTMLHVNMNHYATVDTTWLM